MEYGKYQEAVKVCYEGCEKDNSSTCEILAGIFEEGIESDEVEVNENDVWIIEPDMERAKLLYEKACKLNSPYSCVVMGRLYRGVVSYIEENYDKSIEYFHKACDLNDSRGCNELGNAIYYHGKGDARKKTAMDILEKSCVRFDEASGGCRLYFEILMDNNPKDIMKGINLFEKVCSEAKPKFEAQNDRGYTCETLADIYYNGEFKGVTVPQDTGKAVKFSLKSAKLGYSSQVLKDLYKTEILNDIIDDLTKKCDSGKGDSCLELADIFAYGPKGSDQTKAIYSKACALNNNEGCYMEGLYTYYQSPKAENSKKGLDLMEKACKNGYKTACEAAKSINEERAQIDETLKTLIVFCDQDDAVACRALGNTYNHTSEFTKALDVFEKGCDLKDGPSCISAAEVYVAKDEAKADMKKALSYVEKSCGFGYPEGCLSLGIVYFNGYEPIAKNEKKAREYLDKACKLGLDVSCEELEEMQISK